MTPAERFGLNLRQARRGAGLTQEDLGFAAEVHRSLVTLYENGARLPRAGSLLRLAGACKVTPGALLAGIRFEPATYLNGRLVVEEVEDE